MKTTATIDSLQDTMVNALISNAGMTEDDAEREAARIIPAVVDKAEKNLGEIVTWYSMDITYNGHPDFYIEGSTGKVAHVYFCSVTGRTVCSGYFSFNVRTVKSIPAHRREREALSRRCLSGKTTTAEATSTQAPKAEATTETITETVEQVLDSAVADGTIRPEFREAILSGRCTADEAASWGLIPRWIAIRINKAAASKEIAEVSEEGTTEAETTTDATEAENVEPETTAAEAEDNQPEAAQASETSGKTVTLTLDAETAAMVKIAIEDRITWMENCEARNGRSLVWPKYLLRSALTQFDSQNPAESTKDGDGGAGQCSDTSPVENGAEEPQSAIQGTIRQADLIISEAVGRCTKAVQDGDQNGAINALHDWSVVLYSLADEACIFQGNDRETLDSYIDGQWESWRHTNKSVWSREYKSAWSRT